MSHLYTQSQQRLFLRTNQVKHPDQYSLTRESETSPALTTCYTFSRACDKSHVFARLSLVASFHALATGYKPSCVCQWLRFPRLLTVFVFTLLSLVICFPTLAMRTAFIYQPHWCSNLFVTFVIDALSLIRFANMMVYVSFKNMNLTLVS